MGIHWVLKWSHRSLLAQKGSVSYYFHRGHSCDLYRRGDLCNVQQSCVFPTPVMHICTKCTTSKHVQCTRLKRKRHKNCHARKNGRVSFCWLSNTVNKLFISVEKTPGLPHDIMQECANKCYRAPMPPSPGRAARPVSLTC